jgi:hypothetical protein
MKFSVKNFTLTALCLVLFSAFAAAQSRRSAKATTDADGTIVSVTAWRADGKTEPIKPENLYFYENGIEQKIKNFSFDPSPARIVLLVDNSQTLPTDIEKLKQATMEFAYEIFDGDQLFVIAYDEKPEIIQEWTDDSKKWKRRSPRFAKKEIRIFSTLSIRRSAKFCCR